jgi:phosphohistidine phosphatase
MKTIYLVRHANAIPRKSCKNDIERPLDEKGKERARFMAKSFKKEKINPDLIISSPSIRALKTATIFANELIYPAKNIIKDKLLYLGKSAPTLLNRIKAFENNIKTIIIVAHNPLINLTASYLIKDFQQNLPKAGVIGIEFSKDSWKEITRSSGKLSLFDFPIDKKKMAKTIRKDLTDKVFTSLRTILKEIDEKATIRLEKRLKNISLQVVDTFIKNAENYKYYYLDAKAHQAELKSDLEESKKDGETLPVKKKSKKKTTKVKKQK